MHLPFRADHVGSLLRPPELLQARGGAQGRSSPRRGAAPRSRTRRSARRCGCRRRSASKGVTDGEYPPRLLAHGFSLPDRRRHQGRQDKLTIQFHNESGDVEFTPGGAAHHRQADAATRRSSPRISPILKSVAPTGDAEADHPVAVHDALPRRPRRDRRARSIPTSTPFWHDLGRRSMPRRSRRCGKLGCTYLQLDDTSLAYLNDPAQRAYVNSIGGDGEHQHLTNIRLINAALAEQARRHDRVHAYVPRQFPLVLGGRGRLRPCRRGAVRRARRSTASFSNTTTRARAASSRCASCRKGNKRVVLGPRHQQARRAREARTI